MKHSVLFLRLFSVVVLMILMTALFTTGIYTYVSRNMFTQIKEDELLRKAQSVVEIVGEYQGSVADLMTLFNMFTVDEASSSLLGAQMVVVDVRGQAVFVSESIDDAYRTSLVEAAAMVLSQGALRTAQIPVLQHTSMVGVGLPIVINGHVSGAVLLLVPLVEALVAMGSLNGALALSLMLSLPLTAVIVYYVIWRVVKPLRQMQGVATKMAGGDFTQRADASQRGEVGELGAALNHLSNELSKSISTLTLERNRLEQAINGLSEGIVAVDRMARITHINSAVERLFAGAKPVLWSDERLFAVPDESVWQDFRDVVEHGEMVSRTLSIQDRVLMMNIAPIHDEQGEIAGAVALFSDITESERLERTRRDYVANVSHEMRTPLTAMRALLEPLSDGMVQSEQTRRRYYEIMLRETMRLSRLINDLLELSRLQSGALALSMQPILLNEVLHEVQDKFAPMAEERGQRFLIDDGLWSCPEVLSNADRVEQVLVILVDNAIKYTPEGGDIRLTAEWDDAQVRLSVQDSGVGIDEKDLPYVFDRFYKVDRAHSGLGSGLGLSIASELLKLMGERIYVTSELGEGSTFTFTLSRAGADAKAGGDC